MALARSGLSVTLADPAVRGLNASGVAAGMLLTGLLASYHQERLQAAQRNVQVTNRTARYLRAPEGVERLFRRATIGLAKRHGFARQLINTGRMAEANRAFSHYRW